MNVILSPAGTVDPIRPGQGIGDIAAAGFTNISLDKLKPLATGIWRSLSLHLERNC